MNTSLVFANLVNYSLQIGMLVGLAAFVPTLLRLRQPGGKLVYWQILLAACVLLPLQPWKQIVIPGTVEVTTVVATVQPVHLPAMHHTVPRSEIALLLALAGAAIRLGWLAVGFCKLRRYRRHSRPLEPAPTWSVEAALMVSDEISSPVTFGWRKPVVLLPANFPMMDERVKEAILCHEIMHIRRGDWVFTVGEELVRAALWFHPAIWWLLGEIGLAREQEVDRLAIEITQEREEYMDALLAIAGARTQLDLAPAPLFLRKRHLKQRVVLILKEAKMSKTRLISSLVTSLGMLALACWLVTGAFPLTAEPQVVNDGPGVTVNLNGATVMHRTSVNYPAAAVKHGIQGTLQVELKLDAAGNVSDAHVLSGPDELRRAALESVLQWHFTRDAAGGTRMVQIAFELPKPGTVEEVPAPVQGVVGGVAGGVRGGVLGGVIGSVPAGMPPPPPPPAALAEMRQAQLAAALPRRARSIRVVGLPDAAATELLATLPIHEGDQFSTETLMRVTQLAKAFDEHLLVRMQDTRTDGQPVSSPVEVDVIISAPGMAMVSTSVQRIKVGGNVQSMQIIRKVVPVYPELAKQARVEGVVHLAAVIAADGTIQELHSLGGPALLIQSAMDAVKQWVYHTTLLNGNPVSVETTIDVNFTLNQ